MGKPKTPEPPSPKEQAAAQTSTNISTALANNALSQTNQVGPYGSQTWSETGSKFIADDNGQTWYRAPDGSIVKDRPMLPGSPTGQTQKVPIYSTVGGPNGRQVITGYKDEAVGGDPQYDPAYTEMKGYYIPTSTLTTTLDPAQQAILDQNNRAGLNLSTLAADQSSKLNNLLSSPFSLDGAPAAGTAGNYTNLRDFMSAPELATSFGDAGNISTSFGDAGDITRTYGANDYSADRQKVEDALMARMQPSLDQNKANLRQQLVNRGLQPGSVAYNRAFDEASRAENDARLGAILSAGQEQSRLVGMDRDRATFENSAQQQDFSQQLARGQFGNAAQQQIYDQLLGRANFGNTATQQNADNAYRTTAGNNAVIQGNNAIQTQKFNEQNALRAQFLNEQYALRNQPINEITSLLSGAQVQNPNFSPTQSAQMPTVDMAGLMQQDYQNRVAAAQAKSAGTGAILGGLASLFSLSDKTAKRDIKKVGKLKGHNLYEYRYRGEFDDGRKHIGVMAQEAEKKRPDAVRKGADGLRRVNYGALFDVEVPVGA
ncbi:tail fiber domain-containing protein [Rhizobium sp. YJ-22]|uniref:tail fiber domain-containing protein n=1 Tax=Rhizobium sp. YJ-22 TaxID=3037556 RepID=UPI002412243A|nr:tail fiber domain-containing protein [Rhizobium sp. YJ-22]MDG3577121.1 tail fiber domain-containing protein [Rhizobium sp. YJ-22]